METYILGIKIEQCTREEKSIIKRYETGAKVLARKEEYESGIYIKNIKNIVDYTTQNFDNNTRNIEYITDEEKIVKNTKNQILMNEETIEEQKEDGKYQVEIKEGKQRKRNSKYEIKVEEPKEDKPRHQKKYTIQ